MKFEHEDGYLSYGLSGGPRKQSDAVFGSDIRWSSKVAENEAMIRADLKNIFSEKISSEKYFFELRKVGNLRFPL